MSCIDETNSEAASPASSYLQFDDEGLDDSLPQCKIKRNYSCNICSFFSQNPRSFLYHMRDVHFDKIKIYECSKCLYASKHSQKLQRHINMIHASGKRRTRKTVEKKPAERSPVADDPSEQMVQDASAVTNLDGGDAGIKCSLCSFTSKSTTLLRRHERVVHLKKKFLRCAKCSYVTHVKARFTKHVKYHSMPMIKCDLCDFRTPYKWNLDRHYKNHCGSGAFQCSKCNFRADIKQSLTVHEMNHHVPPVGAGAAVLMRKRNKVGASETTAFESDGIDQDELELLRLEREDEDDQKPIGVEDGDDDDEEPDLNADPPSKLQTALNRPLGGKTMESGTNFARPGIASSSRTVKNFKCKFCSYKATFSHEVTRHEKRIHGFLRGKRPPPNLIPIQGKATSPILKIPEVRGKSLQPEEPTPPVDEEEFNKLCKKSSLTSSLKEFVSLIGDEDGLKSIPDNSDDEPEAKVRKMDEEVEDGSKNNQTDLLKKRNATFFDKLKEKLINGGNQKDNLECDICGHKSKCLSESISHEKRHDAEKEELLLSGSELSSTRCQHCRQRCKTSADLVNHLKVCTAFNATYGSQDTELTVDEATKAAKRVFVWTELPEREEEEEDGIMDNDMEFQLDAIPECSVELTEGSPPRLARAPRIIPEVIPKPSVKKVFKCPHCSFWASTASRFHVHIVGHLNKKPFECSLCNYRSNWRWDITKHIRLKSARDPTHAHATVNMTDETGRRNYSKYNKYLTMMKVSEPSADSSGTGRRTRACEATQGTVSEDDILQPIPALPQLTPAPQPAKSSSVLQGAPLRPPPPLQAAHRGSASKRTLWKCKKCLYRNCDKEKVLAHVKNHYGQKGDVSNNNEITKETPKEVDVTDASFSKDESESSPPPSPSSGHFPYACGICPFTANAAGDLQAHKLNHVDRPGSIFKCTFCPFYVPSKIAVLEHMDIHWEETGGDISALKFNSFDPGECLKGDSESPKRYSCRQCPYVSSSKNQFLYHKQFHRPRDTPFKCMYCSYNVSRRHLLHQHLRVHHTYKAADSPIDSESCEESDDVPLVWINRGGSFLKMFRCRWCTHVSLRKEHVLEHEKIHVDTKLSCCECDFTCTNPNALTSHMKAHENLNYDGFSTLDESTGDQTLTVAEPEVLIKVEDPDVESSTPESSYYQSSNVLDEFNGMDDASSKFVQFCQRCPARFLHQKELDVHSKFHLIRLPFKCEYCSYTARQKPHLLAHFKVHGREYQERTAALIDTYMISADHRRPKTAMILRESSLIHGPVWTVISSENMIGNMTSNRNGNKTSKPQAKHSCHRCPAKFFKSVALQYHLTLHGGSHQHKCKYCDYTVKTYGNLIKHQLVHETNVDKNLKPHNDNDQSPPIKKPDPQFGTLMHGSPDFIYPTYLKNGKLREKRYKCHKCPSAFEKRDQYRIHLSLHGSKQRYKCEKCDYSVKYYANYIQHMKKHQHNDEAHQALEPEAHQPTISDSFDEFFPAELTMIEKQTLLIDNKRKLIKNDEVHHFCGICPFMSLRKDCIENHERRHFQLSGNKYAFECEHCDYSTTKVAFLQEHTKIHFRPTYRYFPEAFLKADMTEIWSTDEDAGSESAAAIFRDGGEDAEDRFQPPMTDFVQVEEMDSSSSKMYIDPINFEPLTDEELLMQDLEIDSPPAYDAEINGEDLIEMVLEKVVEAVEKPKVKRLRGKNWRCKKCPHAFGKKDQFLRHISLHGSQQRYSCHICDYSVKFYTNYVQHMRMHQSHEPDRIVKIKQYVASADGGGLQQDAIIPAPESHEPDNDATSPTANDSERTVEVTA